MIESYFNATADEVKKRIDYDGYTNPVLETLAYDVDCRKKENIKLVRNDKGEETVSSIEVWLPPDFEMLPSQSEMIFNEESAEVIKSGYVTGIKEKKYLRVFLK